MPYREKTVSKAYQKKYYATHKGPLRRRARLRQRVTRHTKTLWHMLDNPQGFCAAMAQRAINEWGVERVPSCLNCDDLQQDIAEALIQGKVASRCTNAITYAATLAIRVARQQLRKAYHVYVSEEKQRVSGIICGRVPHTRGTRLAIATEFLWR